jgi:hypothetical protein
MHVKVYYQLFTAMKTKLEEAKAQPPHKLKNFWA